MVKRKPKVNDLLYCLISILDQYTYIDFDSSQNSYKSSNNAVGYAVSILKEFGYAEYTSDSHWPQTKNFKFKFTDKGLKVIGYDKWV